MLCAAPTRAARTGAFAGSDEPIDAGGSRLLAAIDPPGAAIVLSAPERAARDTAAMLADTPTIEPRLRDQDAGRWTGRSLAEIAAGEGDALAAWLIDPAQAPPEGESLEAVAIRVGAWLAAIAGADDRILAVTHAAVVRGALAVALAIPAAATLAIDLAPLSATRLSFNGRWRLQGIGPAAARTA